MTKAGSGAAAVAVPGAPTIPGLRFRRFRGPEDLAPLAELLAGANLADGVEEVPDEASLRVEYEHPRGFDPADDTIIGEIDRRMIAFGQVSRRIRGGRSVYSTTGAVDPGWRRRGLGRAILRFNERRIREKAAGHDDRGGRVIGAWIDDGQVGARALLEAEGYRPVRYGFEMIRRNLGDVPTPVLPAGLEIRPVRPEHHRAIWDADTEAFRDHWEATERTEGDFIAAFASPYLDTSLWRVAWHGGQVAGSVMATIWTPENDRLGVRRAWLEHVSVRRPWRRRGLARALIVSALAGLRERGIEEAMLGVDAENPTGALGLYEGLGFVVKSGGSTWRKAW